MMTTICQFLSDRIVKENKQIRNANQDLRYNNHVTCTPNDMEKSQRTVKVLNVSLDNSFPDGPIQNMNALCEIEKKQSL